MTALTDFLLARITEDEADSACEGSGEYASCYRWSERHERDVEAKRRIVAAYLGAKSALEKVQSAVGRGEIIGPSAAAKPIIAEAVLVAHGDALRALASTFADHPDYDEGWTL